MTFTFSDQWAVARAISDSFYHMQGGGDEPNPKGPNEGDLQLAFDVLNSPWFEKKLNEYAADILHERAKWIRDGSRDVYPKFELADWLNSKAKSLKREEL